MGYLDGRLLSPRFEIRRVLAARPIWYVAHANIRRRRHSLAEDHGVLRCEPRQLPKDLTTSEWSCMSYYVLVFLADNAVRDKGSTLRENSRREFTWSL
jgi:hypothetical protein